MLVKCQVKIIVIISCFVLFCSPSATLIQWLSSGGWKVVKWKVTSLYFLLECSITGDLHEVGKAGFLCTNCGNRSIDNSRS